MSGLLNMLMGSMTSQSSVDSLSGKTGLSQKQISMLMAVALPMLLKAMTKNASSQQGVSSLLGALSQHSNTGKKSVAQQIEEADTKDGEKIVGHIFGKDTDNVMNQIAGQTGVSPDQVSAVLAQMAPAMMSGVSQATSQAGQGKASGLAGVDLSDGFDMKDVMGLLGAATSGKAAASGKADGSGKKSGGADLLSLLLGASK